MPRLLLATLSITIVTHWLLAWRRRNAPFRAAINAEPVVVGGELARVIRTAERAASADRRASRSRRGGAR
jgi:hypothetical protein